MAYIERECPNCNYETIDTKWMVRYMKCPECGATLNDHYEEPGGVYADKENSFPDELK